MVYRSECDCEFCPECEKYIEQERKKAEEWERKYTTYLNCGNIPSKFIKKYKSKEITVLSYPTIGNVNGKQRDLQIIEIDNVQYYCEKGLFSVLFEEV